MAEWLKAAVLKTVERKFRGFESYFLRHIFYITLAGEVTELADGARLLSECGGYTSPRVRIPVSPPFFFFSPGLMPGFFIFWQYALFKLTNAKPLSTFSIKNHFPHLL